MENNSGWKSSKKNRTNIIIGDKNNPTQFSGGEVIINKKATKKNLKRLEEINDDGSSKTTTDASDGGLLSGPSHDNGGIPGIVGGVRQIETEGDEFVVSQEASEKHWKELSAINQSTGGVAINKPSGADDDPEEYKEGGKIKFQANKLPNKRILNYAEKIKAEYPKVWDLGGNIFGNQAFKNLKRVSERGFWLDSEEWMFIKWRSYVARHQKDFRIEGVIAMLKWVDKVEKGWPYMKQLIEEKINKIESKKKGWKHKTTKMKTGGPIEMGSKKFMQWYIDWYKGISDLINITFSLPNQLLPFKENNVVIFDLFEKKNQKIDAKKYLQEIVNKADELGVVIYLEPKPRHKYFFTNEAKKKKITKEYLIDYYTNFGFEVTQNKKFMKRLPQMKTGGIANDSDSLTVTKYILNRHPKKDDIFQGGKVDGYKIIKIKKLKKDFGIVYHILILDTKKNAEGKFNKRIISYRPESKKITDFLESNLTATKGTYYTQWDDSELQSKMKTGGSVNEIDLIIDIKDKQIRNDENYYPYIIVGKSGEKLGTIELMYRNDLNAYQVSNAKVYEKNKGIGKKAYIKLSQTLDKPIYSDSSLTTDAKYLWDSLVKSKFAYYDDAQGKYRTYKRGGSVAQTPALPPSVKKDALDIVLKGGYRYELDKLRNPHKKKFTNFSDEISLDVSYALIYALFNGLITVENNPGNTHFWVYGYTVIHRDKEGIKEMMDENDFEKYIKLGIVTQNQVDKIIEESGNIQMKTGGRTIAHGGDMSKHLAPNGKPSNLTPEQYKLVRTPAFKQWFGDWENDSANASKVVDENGEPLVVFHGTNAQFWKFDKSKGKGNIKQKSINFSSKKEVSKDYGSRIIECFLNIRNPYIKNYNGESYWTIEFNARYENKFDEIPDQIVNKSFDEKIYDGVILLNIKDSKSRYSENVPVGNNYYAFNNKQIKLADGTNTTFDGNNPDIRFAKGGYSDKIDRNNIFFEGVKKSFLKTYPGISIDFVDGQIIFSLFEKELVFDFYTMFKKVDDKIEYEFGKLDSEETGISIDVDKSFNYDKSKIIDYLNNQKFKDGGELDDPSKIISASSRFRPAETIFFDPALVGPNGNKLISYTWKYQWTVDFNKTKGEEFEKRVSDWTQAEESAETGRNIVHAYTIEKPNGEVVTVSSESVPILMGLIDREQKKVFANLATAAKTLAKQQMKLAILEAQQKEYEDAKRAIIDAGYPEISIKPGWDETDVVLVMGDGTCHSDTDNPFQSERVKCVQDSYVRAELKKLGIDPYKSDVSYQIDKLKPLIDQQKRKVENIIATEKMANGGPIDEISQIKSEINHLYSKAFKMMPNSPRQKEVIKQIDELRLKLENMGGKMAQGGPVDPFNFTSYEDAQIWMNQKSKEYKNQNEFYTSDEYKLAYPIILKLYEVEKSSYSKMAKVAMQEASVNYGDRVFYDYLTPFMDSEKYSGVVVERNGLPYVKFDEGQQTISGAKSTKWHKGWKKETFAQGGPVDGKDTVTVDIPLMIRLLELSKEDIKSDAELHMVVERLLDLKNKPVLTMDDYSYIAEIEHKHLQKMALGGNIETEKLISQAHTNLTVKRGRRDYAPTTAEIQEEIDRMIMEEQFGSTNI